MGKLRCAILVGCLLSLAACIDPENPIRGGSELGSYSMGLSAGERIVWHGLTTDFPQKPQVSYSADGDVTLELPGYFLGLSRVDGGSYARVIVPGYPPLTEAGYPELPRVRVNLMIPPTSRVDLEVVEEEHLDLPMPPPLPSRGDLLRNQDPDAIPYAPGPFYGSADTYPARQVEADRTFVLREHSGLPIEFHPFVYDNDKEVLRVFTKMRVRVHLPNSPGDLRSIRPVTRDFEPIYESTFLNYAKLRYTELSEPGRLIIITADAFDSAAQTLRQWKQERGLPTRVVKYSEIGKNAEAIKAFIKAEYAKPGALTYVVLVGDSDTLPTLKGSSEAADSDPVMAMVAGDDAYPDLFISRISARTLLEVEYQVDKLIRYERNPDPTGEWYTKAIGIGSNEGSPTDWERIEELRTVMEAYGYTAVAKIYDPAASRATLTQKINEGASFINYIGHGSGTSWVTTGFATGDALKLTNGNMLPVIVDVACLNGSFVNYETCFAESWMRAGTRDKPAGAVAMYSASTNASWVPPCVMQSWLVKDLLATERRQSVGGLFFGGAMKTLDQYGNSEGKKLVEQYNIFGDASLLIRTKKPIPLAVEHAELISQIGGTEVTVTTRDGKAQAFAAVTLTQQGEILAMASTDAQGLASLVYDEIGGETVRLTVYAFNAVPYQVDLGIDYQGNHRPLANAGPDQTVRAKVKVWLDGAGSSDEDGNALTYKWRQLSGIPVALDSPTAARPSFVTPNISDAAFAFELLVNDGKLTSKPDTVSVVIQDSTANHIPVANAGADQRVIAGKTVTLNGASSADPDGDSLRYAWTQTGGPSVQLNSASSAAPSFLAPDTADQIALTFQLVVDDGSVQSVADSVEVVVDRYSLRVPSTDTPKDIPDKDPTGITSVISVTADNVVQELVVAVDITHTFIGDLEIKLTCPNGKTVVLHDNTGGSADDIHQTYPVPDCQAGSAKGDYKLNVVDTTARDTGTLTRWELRLRT